MPANSVDSIVTDPPYGLGKEPDAVVMLRDWLDAGHHDVKGGGFMGKDWDAFVPQPALWVEARRVLKPGGHLVAFAGSLTVDLMGLAIRLAGFEIRDQLQWLYGSGFPKSLNVNKAIQSGGGSPTAIRKMQMGSLYVPSGRGRVNYDHGSGSAMNGVSNPASTADVDQWSGWGTALKPAHEPIVLARKPLDGTVAANVAQHGTGALNIDACRVDGGRWPANVLLDAEAAELLDEQSGPVKGQQGRAKTDGSETTRTVYGARRNYRSGDPEPRGDSGGPSRFFYCAKASTAERDAGVPGGKRANNHPTVKPIEVMRWLVRLVTPKGGLVLDPFTGSGTTGIAAVLEGMRFTGVEQSAEYVEIAKSRIAHWAPEEPEASLDEFFS